MLSRIIKESISFCNFHRADILDAKHEDVTGPSDAQKGIIAIYDIFGYFDQTLQGADILATSDDHTKYKVFIPDWFKGEPCPIEW